MKIRVIFIGGELRASFAPLFSSVYDKLRQKQYLIKQ